MHQDRQDGFHFAVKKNLYNIIKLADECCLQTAAVNMTPPKVLTRKNFTKFSAVFVFFQKVLVGT